MKTNRLNLYILGPWYRGNECWREIFDLKSILAGMIIIYRSSSIDIWSNIDLWTCKVIIYGNPDPDEIIFNDYRAKSITDLKAKAMRGAIKLGIRFAPKRMRVML